MLSEDSDIAPEDSTEEPEKRVRALRRFSEGLGVEAEVEGAFSSMFGRETIDSLLQQSLARWTVHAKEGVHFRSWKLEPLLHMCRKDPEMSGMLRKAFSESAIKKIAALDSAMMSLPSGWRRDAGRTNSNAEIVDQMKRAE